MARLDIAHRRLVNQLIDARASDRPADVVKWFGAVQAQDYAGALWAIGLRSGTECEQDVEQAVMDRSIVRTWPMRGTLHFVAAEDVRWMLELLAPRVIAGTASRYRQLELDSATFARSRKIIIRALEGGKALDRRQLYKELEKGNVSGAGQRGIHILGRLAQEGIVCFGSRIGKQHTFVLLDEWVPRSRRVERTEALVELTKRYFTSHGPATVQDFAWWSGLPVFDARQGVEAAGSFLVREIIDGITYWAATITPPARAKTQTAHLLPYYDEYLVAYKDRSAVLDPIHAREANAGGGILNPTIVIGGRVMGIWKRTLGKDKVVIRPQWFGVPTQQQRRAITNVAKQYGKFLGLQATVA